MSIAFSFERESIWHLLELIVLSSLHVSLHAYILLLPLHKIEIFSALASSNACI